MSGASNVFHDMLAYGLYPGHQAVTDLTFHHLPHDITLLFQAQERLDSWKQIYYGCFHTIMDSITGTTPPTDPWTSLHGKDWHSYLASCPQSLGSLKCPPTSMQP